MDVWDILAEGVRLEGRVREKGRPLYGSRPRVHRNAGRQLPRALGDSAAPG
jgi:hypothetical protein